MCFGVLNGMLGLEHFTSLAGDIGVEIFPNMVAILTQLLLSTEITLTNSMLGCNGDVLSTRSIFTEK